MRREIGRIVAAQGLAGELRVRLADLGTELGGRLLFVEDEAAPRRVLGRRPWKDGAIVRLEGTEDRSAAEALVGRRLFGDETDRPSLPEGRFYVDELLGLAVYDESGALLGEIRGVEPKPAHDIWIAEGERGTYLIPAVRPTVYAVDMEARRITVREGGVLGPDAAR